MVCGDLLVSMFKFARLNVVPEAVVIGMLVGIWYAAFHKKCGLGL